MHTTDPLSHRTDPRRMIEPPESLSLEGTPPMVQVFREIGVILAICLGLALVGALYARLTSLF